MKYLLDYSETDFREDLEKALGTLKEGGVILYPTDTVWGLGCDATSGGAVNNIFRIKQRKEGMSLIILVNGAAMLERYVMEIPESTSMITEVSDKPVTIIYPRGRNLAQGVCNEDGSVGVRITRDKFCSELISLLRKPVVSTSANISGDKAPGNFAEIGGSIINSAGYVVKYRQDDHQIYQPSPVIKVWADGTIKIIRK